MKQGFTLIELLVVILIIGILAAIALPQYTRAVEKARAQEILAWLRHFHQAQDMYYLANGTNAPTWDDLGVDLGPDAVKNGVTLLFYGGRTWDKSFVLGNGFVFARRGADMYNFYYYQTAQPAWNAAMAGKLLCVFFEGNKLGKGVCLSLCADKTTFTYNNKAKACYMN